MLNYGDRVDGAPNGVERAKMVFVESQSDYVITLVFLVTMTRPSTSFTPCSGLCSGITGDYGVTPAELPNCGITGLRSITVLRYCGDALSIAELSRPRMPPPSPACRESSFPTWPIARRSAAIVAGRRSSSRATPRSPAIGWPSGAGFLGLAALLGALIWAWRREGGGARGGMS